MKIIGLIPARLNSSRLPQKSLLEIEGIPLVIHTYRRAKLSKKLDELFICCDDEKIMNVAKKFKAKAIMTSSHHANGTERICEGYLKIKKKYDIIVDIQGDEPLISPYHIDQVINFHIKNKNIDIILPHLIVENLNNPNLVKIVSDKDVETIARGILNLIGNFVNMTDGNDVGCAAVGRIRKGGSVTDAREAAANMTGG